MGREEKTNLGFQEIWATRVGSNGADDAPIANFATDPFLIQFFLKEKKKQKRGQKSGIEVHSKKEQELRGKISKLTFSSHQAIRKFGQRRRRADQIEPTANKIKTRR